MWVANVRGQNKIRKEKLEGNINLVREQISSAERDNENYNDRLKSAEEKLKEAGIKELESEIKKLKTLV